MIASPLRRSRLRCTRRSEHGAATLEMVGMVIVASVLAVGLLTAALPQGRILGETFAYRICQVVTFGQGGCTPPSSSPEAHEPTEPCVVSQQGTESNTKVAVVVVTAEDGRRIEIQQLSNGQYRVTVSQSGGAGLEVGVGGGVTVTVKDTTVGANAQASAGASLNLKDGDVYYTDQDGLNDLMNAVLEDQVKDLTVGDGGPVRWLTDGVGNLVGVGNDLPDADETISEGGVSVNASAEATAGTEHAEAGVDAAEVLGTRKKKDGTTTVYLSSTVSGQAGLQSMMGEGNHFAGAAVEGQAQVVTAVTFDSDGNMIRVQATTVASGTSKGLATALFGGSGDAALSNSESQATVFQAGLDIKDSTDALIAGHYLLAQGVGALGGWQNPALLADGLVATQGFFDAAGDRGTKTQQTYDTDANTVFGLDAAGKVGIELGVTADVKTDSMQITDAQYWDGTQWVPWEACIS